MELKQDQNILEVARYIKAVTQLSKSKTPNKPTNPQGNNFSKVKRPNKYFEPIVSCLYLFYVGTLMRPSFARKSGGNCESQLLDCSANHH